MNSEILDPALKLKSSYTFCMKNIFLFTTKILIENNYTRKNKYFLFPFILHILCNNRSKCFDFKLLFEINKYYLIY